MLKRIILPLAIVAVLALTLVVVACGGSDDADNEPVPQPSSSAPTTALDGDADNGGNGATGNGAIGNGEEQTVTFAEGCQKTDQKSWDAAPERMIDTSKTYIATISTEKGDIVLELFSDVPVTTNNFVFLACKGYYDGVTFHRVLPGFVAQGGDPTGSGSGGPGYAIPDEDSAGHRMDTGVISMAKSGPNTTGSQFFITYTPQPGLESDFTVFGRVTEGMDVLEQITPRDPSGGANLPPGDVMTSVTIIEQ